MSFINASQAPLPLLPILTLATLILSQRSPLIFYSHNSDPVSTHSPRRPYNSPKAQRDPSHPQPTPDQRRTLRLMGRINRRIRHADCQEHGRKPIQAIHSRFLQSSHVTQHNRCSEERQVLAMLALDESRYMNQDIPPCHSHGTLQGAHTARTSQQEVVS